MAFILVHLFYFEVLSRCFAENVNWRHIYSPHIVGLSFISHITAEMVSDHSSSKDLLAANKVYLSGFFDSFAFYNLCQVNIEGFEIC